MKQIKHKFETALPPFTFEKIDLNASANQVVDYWHGLMKSLEAHAMTRGEKAAICVADTAYAWTHDDLPKHGNLYFINATGEDVADGNGHGHACAGIIAGIDNQQGVIGIAPQALLVPGACLNRNGAGQWSWFAKVIREWSDADLGEFNGRIRILTASLGGVSGSKEAEDALVYAKSKGVIVVAAAGNRGHKEGVDQVDYPGKLDNLVITVGSIGPTWAPSYFSSSGPAVDVVAWGENIFTLNHENGTWKVSGTSFATPMVAGLCALIASKHYDVFSKAKPADRRDIMETFLKKYAKDLLQAGEDDRTGAGATVAPVYLENAPDAPDDPDDVPTPPAGAIKFETGFRCNVIYRDHRVQRQSIFSNPGGYTLNVRACVEMPDIVTDHWLNMAYNHIETVGFVHRQVALVAQSDTEFLRQFPLLRIRFMDEPDSSLQSIARYFKKRIEKALSENMPDIEAKVTGLSVNNGFVSANI